MKGIRALTVAFTLFFTSFSVIAESELISINLNQDVLSLQAPKLDPHVLDLALSGYRQAYKQGYAKKPYLAVIDYSEPSYEKRLWIFDLHKSELLYNLHVTHGVNSGKTSPRRFSNKNGSLKTSLGLFVTENTYEGRNGYSLRLEGLDRGINHNAKIRGIVMHGADYASANFLEKNGHLGRSWGCPAIDDQLNAEIIELLEHGSILFSYYPDRRWLSSVDYASAFTLDENNQILAKEEPILGWLLSFRDSN